MFAIFMLFMGVTSLASGIYFFQASKNNTERFIWNKQLQEGVFFLLIGVLLIWLSHFIVEDYFNHATFLLASGIGFFTFGIVFLIISFYSSTKKAWGILFSSIGIISLFIGLMTLLAPFHVHKWIRQVLFIEANSIILIILAIILGVLTYVILKADEGKFQFSVKGWWFLSIVVLIIAALIEPHIDDLFYRMRGIKTPWFEAEMDQDKRARKVIQKQQYYRWSESPLPTEAEFKKSIGRVKNILKAKIFDIKTKKFITNDPDYQKELDEIKEKLKCYQNLDTILNEIGLFDFLNKAHSALKKNVGNGLIKQKTMCWIIKLKFVFEKQYFDLPCTISDKMLENLPDNRELIANKAAYYQVIISKLLNYSESTNEAKNILEMRLNNENYLLQVEKIALHGLLGNYKSRSQEMIVKEGIENAIMHFESALKSVHANKDLFSRIINEIPESLKNALNFTSIKSDEIKNLLKKLKSDRYKHDELLKLFSYFELGYKNELAYSYALAKIKKHTAKQYIIDLQNNNTKFDIPSSVKASFFDTVGYVYLRFAKDGSIEDSSDVKKGIYWLKQAEREAMKINDDKYKFFFLANIRDHMRLANYSE